MYEYVGCEALEPHHTPGWSLKPQGIHPATCKAAGCHPIEETTKEIIYVLLTR